MEERTRPANRKKYQELQYLQIESSLWLMGAFFFIFSAVLQKIFPSAEEFSFFPDRDFSFAFGISLIFFILIFRLIYRKLPIQTLREKLSEPSQSKDSFELKYLPDGRAEEQSIQTLNSDGLSTASCVDLLAYYAHSSKSLSESLFSRAGAYLLVGVSVAFSGLLFFYYQTTDLANSESIAIAVSLAPKFGILFFIELVAFFFLRQYRSAMDEFRYYESIKRKREETLALIQLANTQQVEIDIFELIKNESFFSRPHTIRTNESSEIIESRKLERNELDVLEKVIEIIAKTKR